jgi:hypothetical protein
VADSCIKEELLSSYCSQQPRPSWTSLQPSARVTLRQQPRCSMPPCVMRRQQRLTRQTAGPSASLSVHSTADFASFPTLKGNASWPASARARTYAHSGVRTHSHLSKQAVRVLISKYRHLLHSKAVRYRRQSSKALLQLATSRPLWCQLLAVRGRLEASLGQRPLAPVPRSPPPRAARPGCPTSYSAAGYHRGTYELSVMAEPRIRPPKAILVTLRTPPATPFASTILQQLAPPPFSKTPTLKQARWLPTVSPMRRSPSSRRPSTRWTPTRT